MKFTEYVKTSCRESSVHGLPYLVNRRLHWSERLFWLLAILYALYTSIGICWNQWLRFRDNPIIYTMEHRYGIHNIPIPAILICPREADYYEVDWTIEKFWNVTREEDEAKFDYYSEFLATLTKLRYNNLETLAAYRNDETIGSQDFVAILWTMHEELMESYDSDMLTSTIKGYAPAITDLGLCVTTTQVTKYTNPKGTLTPLKVESLRESNIFEEAKVTFYLGKSYPVHAYLFDPTDIVISNNNIKITLDHGDSLTIDIVISYTGADASVRELPIAYRKCLFPDENNLRYFRDEKYRPGFCYLECRLKAAIRLCGCKPFFYTLDKEVPVCDVEGLMCLEAKKWADFQCQCYPLCEEYRYTPMLKSLQTPTALSFERSIMMMSTVSKMIQLRRVVFSTDQLIVGFGGAIGLFLGASFISIYGFLLVFIKYVAANIRACWLRPRAASRRRSKELTVKAV